MKKRRGEMSIGERMVAGLKHFTEVLKSDEPIEDHFTCHKWSLNLKLKPYTPQQVKAARTALEMSQAIFAQFIGVALNTIRAWEQGINVPNPMACRFLDEIRHNPEYWKQRFRELVIVKTTHPKARAARRREASR